MGTSIQNIGNRFELFKDLDVIAVVSLVKREVDMNPEGYVHLGPVLAEWSRDLPISGPGTIDLRLGALSAEAKAELVALLREIERMAVAFGSVVPAAILNTVIPMPGVRYDEYPVSALRQAINRLLQFLPP